MTAESIIIKKALGFLRSQILSLAHVRALLVGKLLVVRFGPYRRYPPMNSLDQDHSSMTPGLSSMIVDTIAAYLSHFDVLPPETRGF